MVRKPRADSEEDDYEDSDEEEYSPRTLSKEDLLAEQKRIQQQIEQIESQEKSKEIMNDLPSRLMDIESAIDEMQTAIKQLWAEVFKKK